MELLAIFSLVTALFSDRARRRKQRSGPPCAGLLLTTGNRILLLLRSDAVSAPGVWSIPGGSLVPDEDPWTAALRESREEMGSIPVFEARGQYHDGRFTTFIGRVTEQQAQLFKPRLNWEHDEAGWFTRQQVEQLPLHPGLTKVFSHKSGDIFL